MRRQHVRVSHKFSVLYNMALQTSLNSGVVHILVKILLVCCPTTTVIQEATIGW